MSINNEILEQWRAALETGLEYVRSELNRRKANFAGYPNLAHKYAAEERSEAELLQAISTVGHFVERGLPVDLPSTEVVEPWCPDVCPITGRPFFMWIEHYMTGSMVPTYGGPYDSYTIPVCDDDGSYCCERYDHDRGGWVVDEFHDVGVRIVGDQAYVSDEEPADCDQLKADLAEADRRAGEAERRYARSVEDAISRESWIRKAKSEWGVHSNVSFDVVWAEALALKAARDASGKENKGV
jgi:hypothetical protein